MRPASVLALLAVLTSPVTSIAAELSFFQKLELRDVCARDLKPLCGAVNPGGGQLAQCIRDNSDKLSPPCRDTIAKLRADLLEAGDEAMDF